MQSINTHGGCCLEADVKRVAGTPAGLTRVSAPLDWKEAGVASDSVTPPLVCDEDTVGSSVAAALGWGMDVVVLNCAVSVLVPLVSRVAAVTAPSVSVADTVSLCAGTVTRWLSISGGEQWTDVTPLEFVALTGSDSGERDWMPLMTVCDIRILSTVDELSRCGGDSCTKIYCVTMKSLVIIIIFWTRGKPLVAQKLLVLLLLHRHAKSQNSVIPTVSKRNRNWLFDYNHDTS